LLKFVKKIRLNILGLWLFWCSTATN